VAKAEQSAMQTPDHQDCQNGSQVVAGLYAIGAGAITAFGTWLKMKLRPPRDPRIAQMQATIEELQQQRKEEHILDNFKSWFRREGVKELANELYARRRS